jgi:Protein of unknown function (DUF1475)
MFTAIILAMIAVTTWATLHQSVTAWGGLAAVPDRYWTIATLMDAYFGFLTFYVWVAYKESRWLPRIGWFVAIMLLGNMAMSAYVLIQLWRLAPSLPVASILAARNP